MLETQITTPPPPPPTPLHWSMLATGEVEMVVVVAQVPAPAVICAAVPVHFFTTTVDAGETDSAPVDVR